MGNNNVGTPTAGVSASARKPASPFRYIPATLVSVFLLALLIASGAARFAEPWFFGYFLKSKGEPLPSTTTIIVSADPGGEALDAQTVARLSAAILERGPAVLALGPSSASDDDSGKLETLEGMDGLPAGAIVISHAFSGFRPWTVSENGSQSNPPILARSLYPLLDGPEPGLSLPMGEGMDLSDTLITRGAREAGAPTTSTGFSAPLAGNQVFSVPAFVRLGRGVVAGLGIEAARRALGVPVGKIGYVEGVGVLFNAAHVLPIDANGETPLRFHGQGGIPRIPASRFLEGRVSGMEVQGKIVFVDPAAPGRPTVNTVAGLRTPTEIQASAAANFMEGSTVTAPAWGAALPVVIGLILSGLVILALILDFSAPAAFILAAVLGLLYPVVALFVFVKSSLWLPPELPPLMVAAAYFPFAITRLLAPNRKYRSPSILPSPGYDPALVSVPSVARPVAAGAPGGQSITPLRGTPQVGQMAQQPPARAPSQAQPQSIPPQQQAKARPQPPKERQGAGGAMPPAEPRFTDPRDPPILPQDQNATLDLRPAPLTAPTLRPAPQAPAPAPVHTGTVGDDIERDGKGGLVRVGKYRIVRKMGFGSGGDVFEGFDTHMGRKVAIKTITKNAAAHFDRASERFVLEAKAAGSLNHPCINTIYDFGTIRDVSYMVLEFLDGITLSQWMRGNPQPPRPLAIAHWLQQISSALDYAHGHKIIHRDLKPSNLMVVNNGGTIKLLDFGIAKMEDVGLTQTGMTVGTPSYMSPEQLSGIKVGPGSDQYGLAVVIYQLFTYKLPYIGTKIPELCNRILKNELIPITDANPSLGAPFWEALRKAMSKTPEERYPNCMGLYAALEAAFPNP
ncbi:MAG: serine/threonine protein kinase [Fibrobacteres bacterium]|nr:serine/threonine protein kinase [Fibrobacterota bacterium]